MTDAPGKFAPNAEVYEAGYYERMYRPHWFLRNRRKYEERNAALLRIVKPSPEARVLEVGSARGDTAFFLAPYVQSVVGVDVKGDYDGPSSNPGGARFIVDPDR